MIVAEIFEEKFNIRWDGKNWRDEAGHIWQLRSDNTLFSPEHGTVNQFQWHIPTDK